MTQLETNLLAFEIALQEAAHINLTGSLNQTQISLIEQLTSQNVTQAVLQSELSQLRKDKADAAAVTASLESADLRMGDLSAALSVAVCALRWCVFV
jgi:hypothetical protein